MLYLIGEVFILSLNGLDAWITGNYGEDQFKDGWTTSTLTWECDNCDCTILPGDEVYFYSDSVFCERCGPDDDWIEP
jgi:hypothetical protein